MRNTPEVIFHITAIAFFYLKAISSRIHLSKTAALAAIIKHHRLSGFNHRHLFLTVLEEWKSRIKVPGDLVPGEASLPDLQMATFLLVSSHRRERERERGRE